jgi:hypothetical protein
MEKKTAWEMVRYVSPEELYIYLAQGWKLRDDFLGCHHYGKALLMTKEEGETSGPDE